MGSQRKWTLRLGYLAGLLIWAAGAYAFSVVRTWPCPTVGACDAPGPNHLHLQLAVWLAVAGGAVIIAMTVLAVRWGLDR